MNPDEIDDTIVDPSLYDGSLVFDDQKWEAQNEAAKTSVAESDSQIVSAAQEVRQQVTPAVAATSAALGAARTGSQGRVMSAVQAFDNAAAKIEKAFVKRVIDVLRTSNGQIESLGGVPVRDLQMAFTLTLDDPPYYRSVDILTGGRLSGSDGPIAPMSPPPFDDPLPDPPPVPPTCPPGYSWDALTGVCLSDGGERTDPVPPPPPPPYVPPPIVISPPPPLPILPPWEPPQEPPMPVPPLTPPPIYEFPEPEPCPPGYFRNPDDGICWPLPPTPPVPPTPPNDDDCLKEPEGRIVRCVITTPVWTNRYWVLVRCRGCKCPEVCVWLGPTPPIDQTWDYLSPALDRPPTDEELRSYVLLCIDRCGKGFVPPPLSPPLSPPESPPTSPPTPPIVVVPPSSGTMPSSPAVFSPSPWLWDNPERCSEIENDVVGDIPDSSFQEVQDQFVGEVNSLVDSVAPFPTTGILGTIFRAFTASLRTILMLPFLGILTAVRLGVGLGRVSGNSAIASSIYPRLSSIIPRFIQRYTGFDLDYYFQDQVYTSQYLYPVFLPDQSSVDRLFLHDRITDRAWTCWTRAHGNLPDAARLVRDTSQERTNIAELVQLWQRGELTDGGLNFEMRKRGVLDPVEVGRWKTLATYVPTPADLIQYMRKEATVPANVQRDQLDWGWPDVFTPELRKWAKSAGISDDVMKVDWQAHWQEISPTQAYEMFRRLRPGRDRDGIEFDRVRLEKTLREADYPPGLIDQLIAISYNPITRTDVIKGNKAGLIDHDEMIERFMDVGYNNHDAKMLARIISQDNDRQLQNAFGIWTQKRIGTEFRAGTITRAQADALLSRTINDPDQVVKLLDDLETLRDAEANGACIKAVKRRFFIGDLTIAESILSLRDKGIDPEQADALLAKWECERDSKAKEYTLALLRKFYTRQIMTGEQVFTNLLHLKYDEGRAETIIRLWGIEIAEADRKRLATEARQRMTDARSSRTDYIREVKFAAWLEDRAEKKKKGTKKADKPKGDK